MPNCKYCGASLCDDSTFCMYCGKAVIPDTFTYDEPSKSIKSEKDEKKGHAVAGLVLTIISALLLCVYVFWQTIVGFMMPDIGENFLKTLSFVAMGVLGVALLFAFVAHILCITSLAKRKRVAVGAIGLIFSLLALGYSVYQTALLVLAML